MSDKRKKAIRARIARTNESYSSARKHVLGKQGAGDAGDPGHRRSGGRFECLVGATIELAQIAANAYAARQQVLLDLNGPSDAERALADHLGGLAADDMRRVEILMYVGRDGSAVVDVTTDLKRDEHDVTVSVVKAKLPVLAGYLREGLRRARDEQIDLDAGWPVSPLIATADVAGHMRAAQASSLGPWIPDPTPTLPAGTVTRFAETGERPLFVVPLGGRWQVILAPGMEPDLIRGSFAAPTAAIACLYADDYLRARGYRGPGVGPLPSEYPALRKREDAWVPSAYAKGVLERGAKCACGYVGEDIIDRGSPCPACGGITVIHAETLLQHVGRSAGNAADDDDDDYAELDPAAERAARKTMRAWFVERYKDPADGVPYAEGDYQYTNGGPYDPWDVLMEQFEGEYPTAMIDAVATALAQETGMDWVRVEDY